MPTRLVLEQDSSGELPRCVYKLQRPGEIFLVGSSLERCEAEWFEI